MAGVTQSTPMLTIQGQLEEEGAEPSHTSLFLTGKEEDDKIWHL